MIYEYECIDCGEGWITEQKITDPPHKVCKECGGKLKKLISNTSFVLKGKGWSRDGY